VHARRLVHREPSEHGGRARPARVAHITDADGAVHELVAGSVVALPVGWSGRCDIYVTVRKLYVTIEA